MKASAVFLDRDGTIIEDSGYISDPKRVHLLPGAAEAIKRLSDSGRLVVLVSNQSGIAREMFTEDDLSEVHAKLETLLLEHGVSLDGAYYCPYLDGPEAVVEDYRCNSELRKPRPGMLLQAAGELDIDLTRSWMIGDSPHDVEAGARAGCRTILIDSGDAVVQSTKATPTHTVRNLLDAAEIVRANAMPVRTTRADSAQAQSAKIGLSPASEEIVDQLKRINDQLERAHRQTRQHDFSVLRLVGALLQMFAIVVALWGLVALTGDELDAATARLMLACFFQLTSISAFAIDRFR